jgi:hypothetical protein
MNGFDENLCDCTFLAGRLIHSLTREQRDSILQSGVVDYSALSPSGKQHFEAIMNLRETVKVPPHLEGAMGAAREPIRDVSDVKPLLHEGGKAIGMNRTSTRFLPKLWKSSFIRGMPLDADEYGRAKVINLREGPGLFPEVDSGQLVDWVMLGVACAIGNQGGTQGLHFGTVRPGMVGEDNFPEPFRSQAKAHYDYWLKIFANPAAPEGSGSQTP